MSTKLSAYMGGLGIDARDKLEVLANATVTVGDGAPETGSSPNAPRGQDSVFSTLTAGTYTLNWQLQVLSSWGFPGVTDATAPKVKITSEPT